MRSQNGGDNWDQLAKRLGQGAGGEHDTGLDDEPRVGDSSARNMEGSRGLIGVWWREKNRLDE